MSCETRPAIIVVAGIILDEAHNVLLSRRKLGKPYAGLWEFPGGKVEPGEKLPQALKRELWEELDIIVNLPDDAQPYFSVLEEGEASGQLVLHAFLCRAFSGMPSPKEGQVIAHFPLAQLSALPMPPADVAIAKKLISEFA